LLSLGLLINQLLEVGIRELESNVWLLSFWGGSSSDGCRGLAVNVPRGGLAGGVLEGEGEEGSGLEERLLESGVGGGLRKKIEKGGGWEGSCV